MTDGTGDHRLGRRVHRRRWQRPQTVSRHDSPVTVEHIAHALEEAVKQRREAFREYERGETTDIRTFAANQGISLEDES